MGDIRDGRASVVGLIAICMLVGSRGVLARFGLNAKRHVLVG